MRGLIVAAIAAVLMVAVICGDGPVLKQATTDGEHFQVTFDKGAVGACTIYEEQVVREEMREFFPNGKYAPRHCWMLTGAETSYDDNWDWILPETPPSVWIVRAEVQYDRGGPDFVTLTSNTVAVTR